MRISREKARQKVERALGETRPEYKSAAWDAAWSAIRYLEARGIGDDVKLAGELAAKLRRAE
jgi:hypothetical protein